MEERGIFTRFHSRSRVKCSLSDKAFLTMDFDKYFGANRVVVDLKAEDRWEAMGELIDHLVALGKIASDRRQEILAAVWKRESSMTTGIGYAMALPHLETNLVTEVVVAFGRSENGIPFGAADGKPVHLVLLMLVPKGQFHKNVDATANFIKLIHRKDFQNWLWGSAG